MLSVFQVSWRLSIVDNVPATVGLVVLPARAVLPRRREDQSTDADSTQVLPDSSKSVGSDMTIELLLISRFILTALQLMLLVHLVQRQLLK